MNQEPSRSLTTWNGDFGDETAASSVVLPVKERNPRLIWLTGNTPPVNRREAAPIGWCVHRHVNPALDRILDLWQYQTQWVEHATETGETEHVEYWLLNSRRMEGTFQPVSCSLFVLARGVSDPREMHADPTLRDGVAYGWEPLFDKQNNPILKKNGKQKKRLRVKFRCYLHEVLSLFDSDNQIEPGFDDSFQVSLSGYLCDAMLEVFESHYRSLEAYNQRLVALGHQPNTPYWAISLPIEPEEKPRTVLSENGEPKNLIMMRSGVPAQVETISDAFLRAHRMPAHLQELQAANQEVLAACTWSKQETQYLLGLKPRPKPGDTPEEAIPEGHVTIEPD